MRNKSYLDWETDLRGAVSAGNLEDIAKALVDGANINEIHDPIKSHKIVFNDDVPDIHTGTTALSLAVLRANIDVVELLIKNGALITNDCIISVARLGAKYMIRTPHNALTDCQPDYENINKIIAVLLKNKKFSREIILLAIAAMVDYDRDDNKKGMEMLKKSLANKEEI